MATSKNHKNWVRENYPRECKVCGYISNNPAMHSYHRKTHKDIRDGELCDFGCGQQAMYRKTSGKLSCEKITQHCPGYSKAHRIRIKSQWDSEKGEQRKKYTDFSFIATIGCQKKRQLGLPLGRKPIIVDPETAKTYRRYARVARARAQRWAKKNGYIIGQQTFHVDHKFSLTECFKNNLSIDIANHPCNLQILPAKENAGKCDKSCITLEELLSDIKNTDKE